MPIVRTFISLPAGIARIEIKKFMLYSFIGSLPWCFALAYAGVLLGDNWGLLEHYWIYVDIIMILGIIAFLSYAIYVMFIKKDDVAKASETKLIFYSV
jgi:membrane protein DedA with SNARE-associated domain